MSNSYTRCMENRTHAGKQVKHPRKLRRIVNRVDTTSKPKLIEIMRLLEPDLTKKEAARAYDRVTAAINGWLIAHTIDMPKGVHSRLLLANCFSFNLCWIRSIKPDMYPDFPAHWIGLNDRHGKPGPRAHLRRLRRREWLRFYQKRERNEQIPNTKT